MMSVVSQQDRVAAAWNSSAVHSAITFSGSALFDDVELSTELEFIPVA
jgi:hypothetical protein